MLLRGDGGDVLLDVRVDPAVDERDPGGVSDQAERGAVDEAGVHGSAPFDGQAEPELRLCTQGASVAAHLRGTGAVNRPERTSERFP